MFRWHAFAPIINLFVGTMLVVFVFPGCGGAKYLAMVKAAQSELSPMAQAKDDLHKLHLYEVQDEQVVLLGVVSGNEERRSAEQAAKGVKEVKGITNWLAATEPEYMSIRKGVL